MPLGNYHVSRSFWSRAGGQALATARVAGHAVSGRATGRFALAHAAAAGRERVAIVPGLLAGSPFDFLYYPFSHSLLAQLLLGLALGSAYGLIRGNWRGALLVGL